MVMVIVECPISSCTVRISTPAITARDAKVCLKVCQFAPRMPACLRAGS